MKRLILIVAAVVVVLIGVRVIMSLNGPDDKTLVREALTESIKASKEGRPGGVMDKISNKLTVNGDERFSSGQIIQFIKDAKPNVTVLRPEPIVTGDEARITSPVTLNVSMPGGNEINQKLDNVTLIFEKEDAMTWLVIPSKQWRLKEVTLPEDFMSQLSPF